MNHITAKTYRNSVCNPKSGDAVQRTGDIEPIRSYAVHDLKALADSHDFTLPISALLGRKTGQPMVSASQLSAETPCGEKSHELN